MACSSLAMKIKEQIKNGNYSGATDTWGELEDVISRGSDGVVRKYINEFVLSIS